MKNLDRVPKLLADLETSLQLSADLVARGREAFDIDPAISLAFESLSNRVGDIAKRLVTIDPVMFSHPSWSDAARNRDFVIHQYHRIDFDALWKTVSRDFPALRELATTLRAALP